MGIRAKAWSDCRQIKVHFDCLKWAEQATEEELSDLISCGYSHDYPADEVVQYMADHDNEAKKLFDFLEIVTRQPFSGDMNGFECEVNEGDFISWLGSNKPHLKVIVR